MKKSISLFLSVAMVVSLIALIPLSAGATYSESRMVYEWNLTDIADEIGYDEAAFRDGSEIYEYNGLTITGANSNASINGDGVKFSKVSSDNGQMNIKYTPEYDGILSITANMSKSGSYYSKLYVDTTLGSRANAVIDPSAAGDATGETSLEGGQTYYIYNGNSAAAYIKSMTYTLTEEPPVLQADASRNGGIYTVTASAEEKMGEMIFAAYSGGTLVALKSEEYAGGEISADISVDPEIDEIKVMLWNSMEGMMPICESALIECDAWATPTPLPTPTPEPTPTPTPTPEPVYNASVTAVYTLDGTAEGEVSRAAVDVKGNAGDTVMLPDSCFAARRFTDTDGLYDIYACEDKDRSLLLEEGENLVYITIAHETGKYYYWEDFESFTAGSVASDNKWYHGGASTNSAFVNSTTDTVNTTTAVRWFSNNTGGSRNKSFSIYDGTPVVPEGEKLVFSADVRMGITNGSNYTKLSFGNSDDTIINLWVNNSITMLVNETDKVKPPSVKATEAEAGGSSRTMSKWFNVNITIDPSASLNNTVVTLTSLDGENLTVNDTAQSSYSYTTTATTTAVNQITANLCKGYFGGVMIDNIKLYNTQEEYLTPTRNELAKAIDIYSGIDAENYTENNFDSFITALESAKTVLADEAASNKSIKDAKAALVNAASLLEPKTVSDGERVIINENADWIFIKENEYQSDSSEIFMLSADELSLSGWNGVDVPHTWNAYDGSDGIEGYDRCVGWYRKNMYVDAALEGQKLYMEFEGAALKTRLYINGVPVPYSYDDPFLTADADGVEYVHRGGYNAFRFDVTDYVNYGESNTVAVSVDNRASIETIPLGGDFSKEGGMYRNVSLVAVNPVHVDMMDNGSSGIYLTPQKATGVEDTANEDFNLTVASKIVNDSNESKNVKIEAVLREPDHFDVPDNEYIKEHLRFKPEDMYTPGGKTVKEFAVKEITINAGGSYDYTDTVYVESPRLWDGLDDPYRYEVELVVSVDGEETERITQNVGFRYFNAPAPSGINSGGSFYLNGRKYPLHGAGKHQDWGRMDGALGIATTEKEMLSDAGIMYELGMNTVRLVHYQHSLHEIELYDKLGIVVCSEPALCSVMANRNANGYASFEKTTLYQLSAMIKQQYNSPSVLFWTFSNEITHEMGDDLKMVQEEESKFTSAPALFEKLQAAAKELDPVRYTTYAANKLRHSPDLATDTIGMNLYPYWYISNSATSTMRNAFNSLKDLNGGSKPISLFEYGGAGVMGLTIEYNEDGSVTHMGTSQSEITSYTTYQAYMHEKAYSELANSCTGLWGAYVWQMFDSANDTVDVNLGGMNTKGLVSHDHLTKKDSYYFYKANWNDIEPFVNIVNDERTVRPDMTTIIRAYSNMDECQLYVNDMSYGEPITDTNSNDKVPDGVGVFMWYDIPLSGNDKIEIRGIKDGEEVCTSIDTNGELVFTTSFDGVSLKSNDTSVMTVGEDTVDILCMANEAPLATDIINGSMVSVLSGSTVSVVNADGTEVTEGQLSEGMKIRVTDNDGNYKDYTVIIDDILKTVSLSDDIKVLNDGNTASAWSSDTAQSITVDLGAEYTLNGMDMYFDSTAPYKVSVSSGGEDYTNVIDISDVSENTVSDKFTSGTIGRYIKIEFSSTVALSEINVYGWRFDNIGKYTFDGNNIYLGATETEHDTYEVFENLQIIGQASYDFELAEAGRVLSDGDKLIVTEEFGGTVEYILYMSDK